MDSAKKFIKQHRAAIEKFRALETTLAACLDRLDKAYADKIRDEITAARIRASAALREALQAHEVVENSRRAYWDFKRAQAEAELLEVAMPLVAEIERCTRASAAVESHGLLVLQRMRCLPRPAVAHDADAPPETAFESDVTDRADEEL
jgi:hypothetical protein